MHELKPFLVPSFAIANASQDSIALAFGPANVHAFTKRGNGLVALPAELRSTFLITEQLLNGELIGQVLKYLGCIAVAYLNRFVELTQFCVHLQNGMVLKYEVAIAGIGIRQERRLEEVKYEIGHTRFLGQHERLMILRAQVALHPDEVDGVLRLRHCAAKKGGMEVKQGRARAGDWGLGTED